MGLGALFGGAKAPKSRPRRRDCFLTAPPASLNMLVVSTNFAKTLVCKREYDVILWRHKQRVSSNNDHHMPLLHTRTWQGGIQSSSHPGHHQTSARHWLRLLLIFNLNSGSRQNAQLRLRSPGYGQSRAQKPSGVTTCIHVGISCNGAEFGESQRRQIVLLRRCYYEHYQDSQTCWLEIPKNWA